MPRYTVAYSNLIKRLSEVIILQQLSSSYSRTGPSSKNAEKVKVFYRAAVVLLSSHIEGYIEELGELCLDRILTKKLEKQCLADSFFYFFSKDIIDEIKNTSDPGAISRKVRIITDRDLDIWSNDKIFQKPLDAERFLQDFSNPKTDEIKRFFARFGYSEFSLELGRLLKSNYLICRNMVDNVVDQRHKIAHGDISINGTPKDIEDQIQLVRLYCRAIDDIVSNWFKKQGCPIR